MGTASHPERMEGPQGVETVTSTIAEFSGSYRFLSNFWSSPMTVIDPYIEAEIVVPTVEHGFQMDKTTDAAQRRWVLSSTSPGVAKRRGKSVPPAADWDQYRLESMDYWLRKKFVPPTVRLSDGSYIQAYHELAMQLIDTGDATLVEGNTWGDTFWGVCCGRGENMLGKMLMVIRAEIRIPF